MVRNIEGIITHIWYTDMLLKNPIKPISLSDITQMVQEDLIPFITTMSTQTADTLQNNLGIDPNNLQFSVIATMKGENGKPIEVDLMTLPENSGFNPKDPLPANALKSMSIVIPVKITGKAGEDLHDALGENIGIAKRGVKLQDDFLPTPDGGKGTPILKLDIPSLQRISEVQHPERQANPREESTQSSSVLAPTRKANLGDTAKLRTPTTPAYTKPEGSRSDQWTAKVQPENHSNSTQKSSGQKHSTLVESKGSNSFVDKHQERERAPQKDQGWKK